MSQPTRFLHCLLFPVLATLLGALSAPAAAQLYLRTAPIEMNTNPTEDIAEGDPRLAGDGAGHWVAVWSAEDFISGYADEYIVVSRSSDNGATWTAGTALNPNQPTGVNHHEYSPDLATDGAGNWIIVWGQSDNDLQQELKVSRSTDNGATWTAAYTIGSLYDGRNSDDNLSLANDGAGHWVVVWTVGSPATTSDIHVARSADNGITWTAAASLSPVADNMDDVTPRIATDAAGRWIAVWATWVSIVTSTSNDNGQTWSSPALIDSGNADLYLSPDIAFGGGDWVIVWHASFGSNERDIWVARSNDNGVSWSQPALLDPVPATVSKVIGDGYPKIDTDGAGNWIATWTRSDPSSPGYGASVFSRSSDNGSSWTPCIKLLPTPGHELWGLGQAPAIVSDRAGHWIALWESTRIVALPSYHDRDILYSRWTGILAPDRDGDDLSDVAEFSAGTSSDWWDTDGDGISDAEEVNTHLTNPVSSDSDGDGAPDISEIDLGTDPNDALDFPILPLSWEWLAAIGSVAAAAAAGYRYRRTRSRAV